METDSDSELLRSFVATGSEDVFRRLVERHAPMVSGVALRATGDMSLAEEVTQTVFALLVSKASSVPHRHLAGWLHNTAFLAACNARRKATRYSRALRQLTRHMTITDSPAPHGNVSWKDIRPHLDHVLSRLSEKSRHMVVLRWFEERSIREIAAATGRSEAASRKELERALKRMAALLKKRGVSASASGFATILAERNLRAAASADLITASALQTAPSLRTCTLFSQITRIMSTARILKIATVLILASVPVAILWRENAALKEELHALRPVFQASKENITGAFGHTYKKITPPGSQPTRSQNPLSVSDEELLKLAARTTIQLFDTDTSRVTQDFGEIFKLTPDQIAAAVVAVRDTVQKIQVLEQAHLEVRSSDESRTEFQIGRFAPEAEALKKDFMENLRRALPAVAYEFIRRDPDRHFKYSLAGFGTVMRTFTLESVQAPIRDEKWVLNETFYAPAATTSAAYQQGRTEIEIGTFHHRFKEIPARFSSLLETPPSKDRITLNSNSN